MLKSWFVIKGVAPGSQAFRQWRLDRVCPASRVQAGPRSTGGAGVGSGLLPEKTSQVDQMGKQNLTCQLSNLM